MRGLLRTLFTPFVSRAVIRRGRPRPWWSLAASSVGGSPIVNFPESMPRTATPRCRAYYGQRLATDEQRKGRNCGQKEDDHERSVRKPVGKKSRQAVASARSTGHRYRQRLSQKETSYQLTRGDSVNR